MINASHFSIHAVTRLQQRGISLNEIDLLIQFGEAFSAGDGCSRVIMDRDGARRVADYLGNDSSALARRLRNLGAVVEDQSGRVVTVFHRYNRTLRKFRPEIRARGRRMRQP